MPPIKATQRPRRPRRKLQTPNPEVEERLLNSAADLIRKRGFPDLTIEEIVDRAGLSVGTFYLYFDSKADLFVRLVTDYTERLRARMEEAYQGDGPPLLRVQRGLDVYLDFVEENEKGFLHFVRAADSIETSVGSISRWAYEIHARNLRPLLEEAIARREMRQLDVDLTAQALIGVTQHMAAYWLEHREKYSREALKAFLIAATATSLAPMASG